MGIFDGCLLASDIDGTLMENGYINPKNVEKIDFFISEGGKFSLSTGRSVGALSDVIRQLNSFSASVVANGCMVYDFENSKILYETVLPSSDHHLAEFILNSGINVGAEIHCGADAFTLKRTKNTTLHQEYEKFEAPDVTFAQADGYNWNKVIFVFDNCDDRDRMIKLLEDKPADCYFIKTAAVIMGEFQYYLEMVPKGVSKASALEELRKIFNIKKGCLFAIGDYYNDLEMIKAADISAVPNTAPDDIKQYADFIGCSCDDGAVADFIDYLVRIK